MSRRPKGLPKPIKSKNPVVILRHVIKAIREEPKRYNQSTYIDTSDMRREDLGEDYFPDCGTVACVAGWVNIISGQPFRNYTMQHERAARVLRLSNDEANEFFDGGAAGNGRYSDGTRRHAQAGIRHIKRFVWKKWGKRI